MRSKYLLIAGAWLLLLFVFSCSSNPPKVPDQKFYAWDKDFKLSWELYKGAVPSQTEWAATTWTWVKTSKRIELDTLTLDVVACFDVNASWVKENKTTYGLNHEQRHFDIAEISARMTRKYLSEWPGEPGIDEYLSFGRDSLAKLYSDLQDQYDEETDHCINRPGQERWDKRIDSMLKAYELFEKPTVEFAVPHISGYKQTLYEDEN